MASAAQVVAKSASMAQKIAKAAMPQTKVLKETSVVIKDFDMSHFDTVYELYVESMKEDTSFASHEVTREAIQKKIMQEGRTFLINEQSTDEVMCVVPVTDSPVVRSTNAMLSTVFALTNPKFRGKGVVQAGYKFAFNLSATIGYVGLNARIPLTTRNIIPSLAVGGTLTGTIPRCSYLDKVGYVDNVMAYKTFNMDVDEPEFYLDNLALRNKPLPVMSNEDSLVARLCAWNEYPTKEVQTEAGPVRLRSVQNVEDVLAVEHLLRSSAEQGVGFGIDEFDTNGHFNRKFLRSPDIIVAESTSGEIIGATLFGASGLSRATKHTLSHFYVTVKDTHAHKGLGGALANHSMDVLKNLGYSMVITDAYMNNFPMLQILRREKFFASGCMPYCAYLKNHGALDSLLFYKVLN